MVNLFAIVGAYTVLSKMTEYEAKKQKKEIGCAWFRIEHGLGTEEDYALKDELMKIGRAEFERR